MFACLAMILSTDESKSIDLTQAYAEKRLLTNQADVHAVQGGVSVGFHAAQWPGIYIVSPQPEDWSAYDALSIEVENPGKDPIAFNVRVDDAPDSDGKRNCLYGMATIAPGKKQRFMCALGRQPMDFGMRALPPVAGATWMGSSGQKIDSSNVCKWLVFLPNPPVAGEALILRDARLESTIASLEGVVDPFGQFAKAIWPGKAKSEAELKQAARIEGDELRAHPALSDRDAYGGWESGPQQKATGRFRTEKIDGKWWFVTPQGHLFWSMGVDCVGLSQTTMVTGREKSFIGLPSREEPLGRFWSHVDGVHSGPVKSGDTFDFVGADLSRKYGANWEQAALERAGLRLRAWGYNTIANWSDPRGWAFKTVPYVVTAGTYGSHRTISTGGDYWGPMPDVFDPKFKESVAYNLERVPKSAIGDPWCLGWFVDNELSWAGSGEENGRFGIAYGALHEGPESPAKQAFIKLLTLKYNDIERLNAAWGANYVSWEAMASPLSFEGRGAEKRKDDLIAFVRLYSKTYFQTIADEIHRLDPDALYLGPRFAWFGRDSVEVCAQYADVVSFNIYKRTVDEKEWDWVAKLDKPCIIGEFHFGALDRGMFHQGLVAATDQNDRAAMYEAYVHSVLDNPSFVGCHWFQYADEPLLGRAFDGENYNIGLVSVVDNPYPEMIAAAKRVNAEAYRRRYSGKR